MEAILNTIFNGLSIGSILVLAALGLAIVFGLMGVINMAHGELMMLGAYTTFVVQNVFKGLGKPWSDFYIFFALVMAFIVAALAGLALERGLIRYLYGRSLETLLATWGVSLILQQFVRSVNWIIVIGIALFCLLYFGGLSFLRQRVNLAAIPSQFQQQVSRVFLPLSAALAFVISFICSQIFRDSVTRPWFGALNVDVTAPPWLQDGWQLGSLSLPYSRMFIMVLTVVCVMGIYFFLQKTPWGLRIRSVTQNRSMSACLGIPTGKVDAITFAIGSGLAGVAGVAVSLLGSVGPNTGQNYIVNTFMVVVIGGVGNLFGTVIGGLVIGIIDYLISAKVLASLFPIDAWIQPAIEFFGTSSMAKVMVFFLIVVFLQFKPAGLFPQKGRTAEV